jgi:hypothetical protein
MGIDQKFIVWKLAGGALKQLIFLLYILIGSHLLGHKKICFQFERWMAPTYLTSLVSIFDGR